MYKKEDEITYATRLIASPDWLWLKEKIEEVMKMREFTPSTTMDNNTLYRLGVLAGMKYCIDYPEKFKKTNESFFNALFKKFSTGKEEVKNGA